MAWGTADLDLTEDTDSPRSSRSFSPQDDWRYAPITSVVWLWPFRIHGFLPFHW